MSMIEERQVTGKNGRKVSGQAVWIWSGYERLWLGDKFRIRADIATLAFIF
jgi:hypothetical protein